MIVLTVVFGTFFNKGTKLFPVYVLDRSSFVLFSFSPATKAGLKSVSGNSSMIKKVYVPSIFMWHPCGIELPDLSGLSDRFGRCRHCPEGGADNVSGTGMDPSRYFVRDVAW